MASGPRAPGPLSGLLNLTSIDLEGNFIGAEARGRLADLVKLTIAEPWLATTLVPRGRSRCPASSISFAAPEPECHRCRGGEGSEWPRQLDLARLSLTGATASASAAKARGRVRPRQPRRHRALINGHRRRGARRYPASLNLTTLDLRDNEIGDEGTQALSSLVNLINPLTLTTRHRRPGRTGAAKLSQPNVAEHWG